jgi:hypothetical protein
VNAYGVINRRLLSLDHAVRLIFQEFDNAFDHIGRADDDVGLAYRARPRQIIEQADPSIDAEALAAEQEAELIAQNDGRR